MAGLGRVAGPPLSEGPSPGAERAAEWTAQALSGAPLRRSLVFIGFMGAGKSTAARATAAALGVEALDSDELLVAELGMPIGEFFAAHGEAEFRRREERLVCELLKREPAVMALGGGALGSAAVRAALAPHIVVLLEVGVDVAWERCSGDERPLARDRERFAALHGERQAGYRAAADATLPAGDQQLVLRALPALLTLAGSAVPARLLWAHARSGDYPVFVGTGLLGSALWPTDRRERRVAVTDATVGELYGARLGALRELIVIEPGEEHKTVATAELIWRALARSGMARDDELVALGGGVVGDVAAFCAATYQRGVDVVHVPTTLVAQVDSAYGGKTGVDLPEGKNYVGSYHQPAGVLVDPAMLASLPRREWAAGQAEVIKTALIAGGDLWRRVSGGAAPDEQLIADCIAVKLAVVAEDERDAGRRQVLNLGHTIGHAIETVTGYRRYRHGEAVGLGLLAALRLSGSEQLRERCRALLLAAELPVRATDLDPDAVVAATRRDKKRRGEEPVPFVLVEAPGRVHVGCTVAESDVRAAVAELVA